MAKLTIRISRNFGTNDLDFNAVTPRQIIDNMRGTLPDLPQGLKWVMLKGGNFIDHDVSLDKLGFKDADTAELIALVEGA